MDGAVPMEIIKEKIYLIRGQKVLLDNDLAEMYGVETKNLNRAVKRNMSRFPDDLMLQLTNEEAAGLRFQFGTSKTWGLAVGAIARTSSPSRAYNGHEIKFVNTWVNNPPFLIDGELKDEVNIKAVMNFLKICI